MKILSSQFFPKHFADQPNRSTYFDLFSTREKLPFLCYRIVVAKRQFVYWFHCCCRRCCCYILILRRRFCFNQFNFGAKHGAAANIHCCMLYHEFDALTRRVRWVYGVGTACCAILQSTLKCLYRVAATIFLTRLTQTYIPLKPNGPNIICTQTCVHLRVSKVQYLHLHDVKWKTWNTLATLPHSEYEYPQLATKWARARPVKLLLLFTFVFCGCCCRCQISFPTTAIEMCVRAPCVRSIYVSFYSLLCFLSFSFLFLPFPAALEHLIQFYVVLIE